MWASILLLLLIALCVALVAAGQRALDRGATDSPVWGFLKIANRTYCQARWGPTRTDRQWVRLPPAERATLVDSVVETLAVEEPAPGPSEQMVVVFDWEYPSSATHGRHVIGSQLARLRYLNEGLIPEYVRVAGRVPHDMRRLTNPRLRALEDGFGMLRSEHVAPQLSQSKAGFRVRSYLEPVSFNYVSWMLFIVFYILIARGLFMFYLLTGTWATHAGIALELFPAEISAAQLEAFDRGEAVGDPRLGTLLLPGRDDLLGLAFDAEGWFATTPELADAATRCTAADGRQGVTVIAIESAARTPYQAVITELDRLGAADPRGCRVALSSVEDRSPSSEDLR